MGMGAAGRSKQFLGFQLVSLIPSSSEEGLLGGSIAKKSSIKGENMYEKLYSQNRINGILNLKFIEFFRLTTNLDGEDNSLPPDSFPVPPYINKQYRCFDASPVLIPTILHHVAEKLTSQAFSSFITCINNGSKLSS